jgi:predicted lipid carrier protein YhbT
MIPVRPGATPPTGNGESIRLSCTSDDAEWVVQLTPDGMKVDRGPRTADVTARGAASDLLLVLWGRIAADAVEVQGDKLLLAGFQDRVRI